MISASSAGAFGFRSRTGRVVVIALLFVIVALASGMFVMGCFGPLIAIFVRDTLRASTNVFGLASASSHREAPAIGFDPAAAYPQKAVACVSTHDLPTLAGWWQGAEIKERRAIGSFSAAHSSPLARLTAKP